MAEQDPFGRGGQMSGGAREYQVFGGHDKFRGIGEKTQALESSAPPSVSPTGGLGGQMSLVNIPELASLTEGIVTDKGVLNELEASAEEQGIYATSLEFPSDIQDVGQQHFIRFTIINNHGATFEHDTSNLNNRKADTSTIGMGGVIAGSSGQLGNAPAASAIKAGAIAQEESEQFLTRLLEDRMTEALGPAIKISLQQAIGGFLPPAIGGAAGGLLGTLGGALGGFSGALGDVMGQVGDLGGQLGEMAGGIVGDTIGAVATEAVTKAATDAVTSVVSSYVTQGIGQVQQMAQGALADAVDNIPLGDALGGIAVNAAGIAAGEAMNALFNAGASAGSTPASDPASIAEAVRQDISIKEDSLKDIVATKGGQSWVRESLSQGITKIVGDILLYVPVGVSESYQPRWGGASTKMGGTLADLYRSGELANSFEDVINAIQGDPRQVAKLKRIGTELISKAAGAALNNDAVQAAVMKEFGQDQLYINPQWTAVFEGVQPRTFTFNFKFAPKNSNEAQMVQQIIRKFKASAAPHDPGGDSLYRYWTYPYTFGIEYWNQQRLHKLKPCALTNISVNYGASGTNHTFYDGFPVQTDVTLSFMETSLMTRGDFEEGF